MKQMEERKNAGNVGNPKELAGDKWGKEECTGKYREEEGESAADVDITWREGH